VAAMNANPQHKLAPLVYGFLVLLAFVAGIIVLGNQAGWWNIDL
jgi:hypothetical protein